MEGRAEEKERGREGEKKMRGRENREGEKEGERERGMEETKDPRNEKKEVLPGDFEGMDVVSGVVVRHARDATVHVGTAWGGREGGKEKDGKLFIR